LQERIREDQLLNKNHLPVKIIFDEIKNEQFLDTIKVVCNGEGFGVELGTCLFPDDLDAYDIAQGNGFIGVEFGLYSGEEIVITYQEFYIYLEIVCTSFLKDFPDNRNFIDIKISEYKKRFDLI